MTVASSLPSVVLGELDRSCERDLNYVRSSWTHSSAKSPPAKVWLDSYARVMRVEPMPRPAYKVDHRLLVDHLLERPGVRVLVAKDGILLAWLAYEPARALVHYVYTGDTFRRFGWATALVKEAGLAEPGRPVRCTHWTPMLALARFARGWTWSPLLLGDPG